MPLPEKEPTMPTEPTISEEDGYLSIFGEIGIRIPKDEGVEEEKLLGFDINLILLILGILGIMFVLWWSNG